MRALIVIALIASTAHADPIARVRWFDGRVAKSSFDQQPERERVVWTFTVTTPSEIERELVLPVSMDSNVWVSSMSVTIGEETLEAVTLPLDDARQRYEEIAGKLVDPALLEYVSTRRGRDELRLRVFPVSKATPATIRIELWVPGEPVLARGGAVTTAYSLVAVPTGPVERFIAGTRRRRDMGSSFGRMPVPTMSPEERFAIR